VGNSTEREAEAGRLRQGERWLIYEIIERDTGETITGRTDGDPRGSWLTRFGVAL